MQIDKQYGNVAFAEAEHKYFDVTDPTKQYISVTTLVHKYAADFNAEFWSAYKALEKLIPKESWKIEKKSLLNTYKFDKSILEVYDISEDDFNKTQQEILDEWEKNKNDSCERGTKIHAEIENSFYKNPNAGQLKKFGIGGKFECKKGYAPLDIEYGVYPEYLIYWDAKDGVIHLAGQIDLLIKQGHEYTIVDHKSNKKIDQKGGFNTQTKSTAKMKYPLNNLDDCNYSHYTMQLSVYAWMIQRIDPDAIIKDLILNHYDHDGNNTLYHCEYRKAEVERMLKDYKRELLKEQARNKRKRIEY